MAVTIAILLVGIFLVIFIESLPAIFKYGISFLTKSVWDPVNAQYGAFTAIYGTLLTSFASLTIAIPLGVGTAIFITQDVIPKNLSYFIGITVELLAAIPSVVLGLWAIFVMEPLIRPLLLTLHTYLGWIPIFSTKPLGPAIAPAILILSIMILPIITSISRDSINQVPRRLIEASYGIGATKWTTILNVILPAALSGISGGVLLALGRAMGETMAVTMVIGNSNNFNISIMSPGYTISSLLANQFGEADGIQVSSLMYAALILMIMTLLVNMLSQLIVKRLSLKY